MLQDSDFPENFIDKKHPDDLNPILSPIIELLYHRRSNHNRLILRICVKISESTYIPVSFICDTGAPSFIYISEKTRMCIESRIKIDELENDFITLNSGKMLIESSNSNINVLGLRSLSIFGLYLKYEEFNFTKLPDFL